MTESMFAAGVGLAGLWLMFGPLEWAFPAWRGQSRLRRGFATDLAFYLGQHLIFSSMVVFVLALVLEPLRTWEALVSIQAWFQDLPLLGRAAIALVLGDLLLYWGHRLQHHSEWLWRFHGVHHTAERLDFLAAHREHPIDGIYTRLLVNLPAVLIGLPLHEIMGLITLRGAWATFIHANVRIPLGPLKMLLGSPQLHHWHHALDRNTGNYANLAPWIDWLFGTYHAPPHSPPAVGTSEPWPQTYLALLLYPFRSRRRRIAGPSQPST